MTLRLAAGGAEAVLCPERGGLLKSLQLKASEGKAHELLWLPADFAADGSGWPGGGAPICFPFAGRVFHEGMALQYSLGGTVRHMPLHGFAYGLPWTVLASDLASATLELTDGTKTREVYPFGFRLTAKYTLEASLLRLRLDISNTSTDPVRMPVAAGVHPYFGLPLGGAGSGTNAHLSIDAREKIRVTPTGAAGKVTPFPETDDERSPSTDQALFRNLILGELETPEASLVDPASGAKVTLRWGQSDPWCYVVLWGPEGRGFHCVEPWMGLPDAVNSGLGLKWLERGESLTANLEILVAD